MTDIDALFDWAVGISWLCGIFGALCLTKRFSWPPVGWSLMFNGFFVLTMFGYHVSTYCNNLLVQKIHVRPASEVMPEATSFLVSVDRVTTAGGNTIEFYRSADGLSGIRSSLGRSDSRF